MTPIIYLIVVTVLFGLELAYFRIAEHFRIIDKPNERSSHLHPTIRGGGIIFIASAMLFFIASKGAYPYFIAAVLLSGFVSFTDDIRSLPNWVRFTAHLSSALLILYQTGLFFLSVVSLALIIVLIIGVINAYNFMDGINGITGFYSLAILVPLMLTEQDPVLREFHIYTVLGIAVFLFFNARARARCFAGDVGSVTMAILILFFLVSRIYREQNLNYAAFLLLYGVDTVLTIIQRIYLRENIFRAHRRHLFQIYCNEYGMAHLKVSLLYAVLQLSINIYVIYAGSSHYVLLSLIVTAGFLYIFLKLSAYKRIRKGI